MDPLTTAAASGLQARMEALDMLANNLANTSTAGYKADREFYNSYMSRETMNNQSPLIGESPVIQRQWTDFSQGTLVPTGNSTDLALGGSGFFAVNGPNGTLYTRSGNFHFSPQGVLVSAEGYPVRLTGNQTLQTESQGSIQVSADGQVSQDGAVLGQLELVDFPDRGMLNKQAAGYFRNPDPVLNPTTTATPDVYQSKIETSNAGPAEAAARMVSLLRHFEMLQHAIKIGTEMNRHAIEEVARVTG
jgi:flagellar basal-body rod protein FlgF